MSEDLLSPTWRVSDNPFVYTDPWTGATFKVYPSAHPDTHPIGYLGDVAAARYVYRSPDEQIAPLQFWVGQRKNTLSRLERHSADAQYEIAEAENQIAVWENEIKRLKDDSVRAERHQILIAHVTTFLDKLTPRDRKWAEDRMAEWQREGVKTSVLIQARLIG